MKLVTIATNRRLRDDAASSYKRMRAAGMPAGDIAAAYRTYAQQKYLYDLYKAGKGNLAAKPGSSRHESGICIDVNSGSAAQKWLCAGGDWTKTTIGEHIRANEYGWYREVKSERWDFKYHPEKDKHRTGTTTSSSAPKFPLRKGYYFGPATGPVKSISGQYRKLWASKATIQKWIKQWQTKAKKLGYYTGKIDGIYAALSIKAAEAIQKKTGLQVDGLTGIDTWNKTFTL